MNPEINNLETANIYINLLQERIRNLENEKNKWKEKFYVLNDHYEKTALMMAETNTIH